MLSSEWSSVIVILGGFHMLMSFMVVVWSVMSDRDLEELCVTFSAPFSVSSMLTGHALHVLTSTLFH